MNLPGWDSLELVTKIHRFFEIGGIVVLLTLVCFEAIAYLYAQRKETLRQRIDDAEANFVRAENGDGLAFDEVLKLSADANQRPDIRATAQRVVSEVVEQYFKHDPNDWGYLNRTVTTGEMRAALKSSDPKERWKALGSLHQQIGGIAYRNTWPVGSPPTWRWPVKAGFFASIRMPSFTP
jgi:hypothetical protein